MNTWMQQITQHCSILHMFISGTTILESLAIFNVGINTDGKGICAGIYAGQKFPIMPERRQGPKQGCRHIALRSDCDLLLCAHLLFRLLRRFCIQEKLETPPFAGGWRFYPQIFQCAETSFGSLRISCLYNVEHIQQSLDYPNQVRDAHLVCIIEGFG